MEKLLPLKDWFTLDEAAVRITRSANEAVTPADLLRLAIDNHLQISLYFDDLITVREVSFETEVVNGVESLVLGDGAQEAVGVEGVWDLAAYGVGREELEALYRKEKAISARVRGLPSRTGLYLHDAERTRVLEVISSKLNFQFVTKGTQKLIDKDSPEDDRSLTVKADPDMLSEISSMLEQKLDDFGPVIVERLHSYYRATELPSNALVVVRKDELIAFERKHLSTLLKPELSTAERASTQKVIAVLAAMAGIDVSKPYAALEAIKASAAKHGLELPASDETIVKYLGRPDRKRLK
jgi:hypothetical protein